MTENRTAELQSLSKLKKAGKLRYWRGTIEMPESELHAICDEIQAEHEQAIAATLGRPKVKKVRGMTYDEHGGEVYYLACSGCGEWIDGDLDCIGEADGPNFCDNCGGEFDGPLLCKRCGELADMEFGDMCDECYWGEGEEYDER